jgi:hypothetical protein
VELRGDPPRRLERLIVNQMFAPSSHTVEHERMSVNVEIDGSPKPLHVIRRPPHEGQKPRPLRHPIPRHPRRKTAGPNGCPQRLEWRPMGTRSGTHPVDTEYQSVPAVFYYAPHAETRLPHDAVFRQRAKRPADRRGPTRHRRTGRRSTSQSQRQTS